MLLETDLEPWEVENLYLHHPTISIVHLSTEEIAFVFSKISVNPDLHWNGSLCWTWRGEVPRQGYGRIRIDDQKWAIHRFMYAWLVGDLPIHVREYRDQALGLDHLCRHKLCCNPAHLEVLTTAENTRRALYG